MTSVLFICYDFNTSLRRILEQKHENIMSNPNAVDSAIKNYVTMRNAKEDADALVSLYKQKLLQAEEIMIDTLIENGLKSVNHDAGKLTIMQSSFGSINKMYEKQEILDILKALPDFKHVVVSKEDFSVKTLGSYVKELEAKAHEHWLEEKKGNPDIDEFNPSMFLPKELVGKIGVSSSLTVRFTRSK